MFERVGRLLWERKNGRSNSSVISVPRGKSRGAGMQRGERSGRGEDEELVERGPRQEPKSRDKRAKVKRVDAVLR